MRRRSHFIATAVFAFVVHLCGSVAFATGLTLCVASDGHLALEIPHQSTSCRTEHDRHHPADNSLTPTDDADHGCQDTALQTPSAASSLKRFTPAPVWTDVTVATSLTVAFQRYQLAFATSASPHGEASLRRTIVLLV